jgi:hypothetical protein
LVRAPFGVVQPIVQLRRGRETERKRNRSDQSRRGEGAHFAGHAPE